MDKMGSLKEKLRSGQPVIGTWINSGSPIVAELIAQFDFDFLCIDVEHSAVDLPQAQLIFQAIQSGNPKCEQFVRLHGVDYALVKRYLDAGARGLIAPLVNSRADAELLVRAAKYPPAGKRGLGFCRANKYGTAVQQEWEEANDKTSVIVQIEDIEAVENIDQIFAVEGLDAAFVGPYDLSASMGLAGQFEHPEFKKVLNTILAACQEYGIVPGIHVVKPNTDELRARLEEGYRLLAFSLDITVLTDAYANAMKKIKPMISS